MVVLLLRAPVAQHPDRARVLGVVGHHHAALAIGAQVLAGVEAEAGHVGDAARAPALVFGAVRLAGVLDDHQSMPAGDLQQRIHVGRLAVQADRNDRLGLVGDRRLERRDVHREGLRIDVDEDCLGARVVDRRNRGHEGERDGDDLVAATDAGGEQGQVQRARAGVDRHADGRAAVGREFLFERRHLGAERERAALQHALDRGVHFGLDREVLGLEIDERNHDCFSCTM